MCILIYKKKFSSQRKSQLKNISFLQKHRTDHFQRRDTWPSSAQKIFFKWIIAQNDFRNKSPKFEKNLFFFHTQLKKTDPYICRRAME